MRRMRGRAAMLAIVLFVSACAKPTQPPSATRPQTYPARFLLTFDDGPSGRRAYNPTADILDQLRSNSVQPNIKAIFFLQTRTPVHGGSAIGRQLMQRMHQEGHVLALHSGDVRGHVSHDTLSAEQLAASLRDGKQDIAGITGAPPRLLRPPFWRHNQRARAVYQQAGLHMLLTDINARDGKTIGFVASPRRRTHFRHGLSHVRAQIDAGALPVVDAVIPIVITFHDTNVYTARRMDEYLRILLEESARVGLTLSQPAFFSAGEPIERAAAARGTIWHNSVAQSNTQH